MKINTKLLSVCAALLLAGAQIVGADGDGDGEMVQRLDGEMRIVEGHIPVPKSNGDNHDFEMVDRDANDLNMETENDAKPKLVDVEIIPYQQFVDENSTDDGTNKEGAAHIKTVIELPSVTPTQINEKEEKKATVAVEKEPSEECCGCFSGCFAWLSKLFPRKR